MRILFITPLLTPVTARWMPLGICSMAAVLKTRGHDTMLFDRTVEYDLSGGERSRTNAAMKHSIQTFSPDIIALSTISPAIHDTFDCVRFIRTFYNETVVAGGHHVTAMPELTLKRISGIDWAVSGEGEFVMASLAEGDEPFTIPGITGRRGKRFLSLPPEKINALDTLPFPVMDILNLPYYLKRNSATIRGFNLSVATLMTSRGCPQQCSFCAESLACGRGVRFHSPEYVMALIGEIIGRYPADGIYFLDNDFLADRNRAETICELMIHHECRLKWAIQTRADRVDAPMLALLKKAGCVKIEMGIETAHQHQLDQVKKKGDLKTSERALRLCRKQGIRGHAYMLTGFENETLEDLSRQLAWLKRLKPDTSTWSLLQLYPGALLYQQKGECFFENQPWSEKAINDYYRRSLLSSVSQEERRQWTKNHLNPWLEQINFLSHLRNNPVSFWFEALKRDPMGKLKGAMNYISTRMLR